MLIITCMVGSPSLLYSQNETGTRNLNDTLYKGTHQWYDSTTAMFQHQFPIIRSIPPLNTSMPLDVLISYIYLDSLFRSPLSATLEERLESWTTLNDTLTYAAKALFTLKDYNPIIFNQYADEASWRTGSDSGLTQKVDGKEYESQYIAAKYHSYLNNFEYLIPNKIYEILKSDTNTIKLAKAYYATLYADYILRVKIISIDSTINKLSPLGKKRYNVTAQIVDTISGKAIPSIPNYSTQSFVKSHSKLLLNDTSTHYTTFEYVSHNYLTGTYFDLHNIFNSWTEDSAFTVSSLNHEFNMIPGQEAIVFLRYDNHIVDNQNDYYNLDLERSASYNALPIIDGNVRDINHIWSDQTNLTYSQWLFIVHNIITKIKNRNY